MKRIFLVLLCVFLAGRALAWTGKVVGVSDGDTVTVLRGGNEQVKIRLYGIDAPESSQPHGKASKANLSGLVFGKTVEVEVADTDRYGRTVARILVGGVCANEEQVRAGYAWLYRQYCTGPMCGQWKELETRARSSRSGLWADASPIPPWEWRRGGGAATSAPQGAAGQEPAAGPYHGNANSGVFHAPGCKHYSCANCTVEFRTRAEAVSSGFRPCGLCKP